MQELFSSELYKWVEHLMQTSSNRNHKYLLDEDHNPIIEPDIQKWAEWFEKGINRRVAVTNIGDIVVSTVFLGYDHNIMDDDSAPILFETMIFDKAEGKNWEDYQKRYCTWDEAKSGHEVAVLLVKGGEGT